MVVVDVWIGQLMISWKDSLKAQMKALIENVGNMDI